MNERELDSLRRRIDAVDDRVAALLSRRARLALRIGACKAAAGKPVYRPGRERSILARIRAANRGPLPAASLERIYREIFGACRSLQRKAAPAERKK